MLAACRQRRTRGAGSGCGWCGVGTAAAAAGSASCGCAKRASGVGRGGPVHGAPRVDNCLSSTASSASHLSGLLSTHECVGDVCCPCCGSVPACGQRAPWTGPCSGLHEAMDAQAMAHSACQGPSQSSRIHEEGRALFFKEAASASWNTSSDLCSGSTLRCACGMCRRRSARSCQSTRAMPAAAPRRPPAQRLRSSRRHSRRGPPRSLGLHAPLHRTEGRSSQEHAFNALWMCRA